MLYTLISEVKAGSPAFSAWTEWVDRPLSSYYDMVLRSEGIEVLFAVEEIDQYIGVMVKRTLSSGNEYYNALMSAPWPGEPNEPVHDVFSVIDQTQSKILYQKIRMCYKRRRRTHDDNRELIGLIFALLSELLKIFEEKKLI